MSRTSLVYVLTLMIGGAAPSFAQTPQTMDPTEWSRQRVEAESRRLQPERHDQDKDFLTLQRELGEQQETRRRLGIEEERRLGPERGADVDPLRGREDPTREIGAVRQRFENERRP